MPETTAFGGGERVLLALSKHLHQRSLVHRFVWYYRNIDLALHANWPILEQELGPPRNPFLKALSLGRYLARNRPRDGYLLLVGIQAALHVGITRASRYVLMIFDTPSLLSSSHLSRHGIRNLAQVTRERTNKALIRRGMKRAAAVIATSRYMADEIKQLYGVEAIIQRQGGLPSKGAFTPRFAPEGRPVQLLSVSRLEHNKRIEWIIEAMAHLETNGFCSPGCRLEIVGDGSMMEDLKTLASRLGLAGNVHFHGYVSDEKLEELYASSHIFLMPARQGYGLPALEALTRGLPVVCHKESGVSEILNRTPWVELVDGNQEALLPAIQNLVQRVRARSLESEPLPEFPTEAQWAARVCGICGWH